MNAKTKKATALERRIKALEEQVKFCSEDTAHLQRKVQLLLTFAQLEIRGFQPSGHGDRDAEARKRISEIARLLRADFP